MDILLFVLSNQDVSGGFFLDPWGCRRGEGDSRAGKGSAVVLQEVCAHTEVSSLAAHVAWQYKAGAGAGLPSSRASPYWEQKGRRKARASKNNREAEE